MMIARFLAPVCVSVAVSACSLSVAALTTHESSDVEFTTVPQDLRVYPRDENNEAIVEIAGRVLTDTWDRVEVVVTRDDVAFAHVQETLSPAASGAATFALEVTIAAELANYDFEVRLASGDGSAHTIVAQADNVVAGDIFLMQGQSNTVAGDYHNEQLGNESQRPWIRSFGSASLDPNVVRDDLEWHLAEGQGFNASGTVGAWGLRMSANIVDTYEVPVAILNGAVGGTPISFHLRRDSDPLNLSTNYGRLLYRAQSAEIADQVTAMFWYQGESDGGTPVIDYFDQWRDMIGDWNEDYPALQHVYVCQVRDGCGEPTLALRDLLRRLPEVFPKVQVMSTTALPGHDQCHFFYAGYRELGDRMFGLLARDFHGEPDSPDISAPNPQFAFLTPARDRMVIVFQERDATLSWQDGVESYFELIGDPGTTVVSGQIVRNGAVLLTLNRPTTATGVSYRGYRGDGPSIVNANGIGMLAFYNLTVHP